MKKNPYISSPMNYIGGKYKLLPQIIPLFPENIGTFVDLFCGGCNVGINIKADKIVLNDNLSYLIDLYRTFDEKSSDTILAFIKKRIRELNLSLTNKDGYLKLREIYNTERNPLDLFVLTAYSFNHQIRFNNSHQFNNPFGKDRSCFNPHMERNLLDFLKVLKTKNIVFYSNNFDELDLTKLQSNDFVYADPPYLITTGTYNDGKRGFTGWNETEEEKLLNILKNLDEQNIKFALSNVIEHKGKKNSILLDWIEKNHFIINYLNKDYSNSNYHTINRDKTSTVEVLVTNYENESYQKNFQLKWA